MMISLETDDPDTISARTQANAAYDKAVSDAIKNLLLFGGSLAAAVWIFPAWTWTTRIVWSIIALSTGADVLTLPAKLRMYRVMQRATFDPMTRWLHVGMVAAIIGGDVALLAVLAWSAFHLW